MAYVIRRKNDDCYYNVVSNDWCKTIRKDCCMTLEQKNCFVKKFESTINDYLIYTIINPVTE